MLQSIINAIIAFVKNLIAQKTKDLNPTVKEYIDLAYGEAMLIVEAVAADPITNAEKKAKATAQLVDFMKKHSLDLPGTLEENVAGAIIEGAYLALKEAGGSFLSGLSALLSNT